MKNTLVVGALFATTVAALQWPAPQISRRAVACGAVAAVLQPSGGFASDEIISTVLVPGDTSSPLPSRAQRVVVDYTLWLNGFEGKQIDTSKGTLLPFPRPPSPFSFSLGVGEVVPGWDKTVKYMHLGETRRVIIPPEFGYGEKGTGPIPGNSKLYFEITLLELKPPPVLSEKQLQWLAEHPEP
jgi:FKBP-type peptidyl-prolyl cis-trans isomerase FkpA